MKAIATENDQIMMDIMDYVRAIVGIAEMHNVPAQTRANAIMMAEKSFHRFIMNKMLEKCKKKAVPSSN